jgi:hypothetical protein
MRRDFFFDAGGAYDFGVTAFDQHRTLGVFGVVAGYAYFTQLLGRSMAGAHGKLSLYEKISGK